MYWIFLCSILLLLFYGVLSDTFSGSTIDVTTGNGSHTLDCDEGIDCTINCDGTDVCQDSTIMCPSNANCDISCNGDTSCKMSLIYCPSETDNYCNVNCGLTDDYTQSCNLVTIHANYTSELNVSCNGLEGCADITVNNRYGEGTMRVKYEVTPGTMQDVLGTQWLTYNEAEFNCPEGGTCILNFEEARLVAQRAAVNATFTDYVYITCGDYDGFNYSTYDPTTDWDQQRNPCKGMRIDAQFGKYMKIVGGPGAFDTSSITCPVGTPGQSGYPCDLYGVRPLGSWNDTYGLSYGDLSAFPTFSGGNSYYYAKDGLNDINLNCDDKVYEYYGESNVDFYKYDATIRSNDPGAWETWAVTCMDGDITLLCANNTVWPFSDPCYPQLVDRSSYREGSGLSNATIQSKRWPQFGWICNWFWNVGELNEANFYCLERTSSEPTTSPSRIPSTEPSAIPTMQPSTVPSNQPTGQPSNEPSAQPSSEPTAMPNDAVSSMSTSSVENTPNTMMPTAVPSTQAPSGGSAGQDSKGGGNKGFCGKDGIYCIIIGVALGMLLSFGVCCFCWQLLKYRSAKNDKQESARNLQLGTVTPTDNEDGNNNAGQTGQP